MNEELTELQLENEDDGDGTAAQNSISLVAGDSEIFRLLSDFRFLRREHLCALTGRSPKRLHRRLHLLLQHRYISRIKYPQQKHIYGLAQRAIPVLVEEGFASPDRLKERIRNHELKALFLKHEMMIVDIHVALSLATKSSPLSLTDWREGRELFDSVMVAGHNGHARLPVRPDAFFVIEDSRRPPGANRASFFLEADRSTMNQSRLQEKLQAYWHYLQQGKHTEKYQIKNFRMLTVTVTEERARNLCLLAQSMLPSDSRKYFIFAPISRFSPADPTSTLGNICLSPKDGGEGRHALVPAPQVIR